MGDVNGLEVVRSLYAAYAEGDIPRVMGLFSDDVELIQEGRSCLAGHFRGLGEVMGHFADIGQLTDGMAMTPNTFLSGGGQVAALNTMTVRKGSEAAEFDVIHLFNVENGQVVRMHSIPEDAYKMDAFLGT